MPKSNTNITSNQPPLKKEKIFDMCESWDKDPDKNMGRYLAPESEYIALKKFFTGTEFVQWFVSTKETKFNLLLKLWVKLNK